MKTFTSISISAGDVFAVIPLPREQSTSVSAGELGKTKVKDKNTAHTAQSGTQGMYPLEYNMFMCGSRQIVKSCHFSLNCLKAKEKRKALAMVLSVYFPYQVRYFSMRDYLYAGSAAS